MNEQPDAQHDPDEPETPRGPAPEQSFDWAPTAPVAPPAAAEPAPTQQHPLTQPVPHVQPPTQPPYPGQPGTTDVAATGGQPAPVATWAPMPAPGTWGAPEAPVWAQPAQAPVPAPGGWNAGPGGGLPPTAWPPSPYGYYPAPPPPPAKARNPKGQVAVVASLVAVLALLLGAGIGHATWPTTTTSATASSPSNGTGSGGSNFPFGSGSGTGGGSGSSSGGGSTTGAGAPSNISGIAAKVSPSLVDINTNLSYQNEQAAGTGIVLTSNGEVLTNNHVIDGATSISVIDIGNGQTYKANVVGYDRTGDIAVIQLVGASGLATASIASASATVGQGVVGVGNAGGAGGTPSSAGGSVTSLNQSITASDSGGGNSENLTGLIEMNCAIEPGDSGGALVTASGQVIGMDTAASSGASATGAASQAYAIPISTALSVARTIEAGKASSTIHIGATGFLGIQVQDTGAATGGSSQGTTAGAVVDGTLQGSPGAGAGLVQGDVITGVDNTTVNNSTDLSKALEPHHPGDVIHLQWTDQSGTTHTSSVTLAVGPPA
jgi:S1-C subfamily serine protease